MTKSSFDNSDMASLCDLQSQTPTPPCSTFESFYATPSFDTASLASESDFESDADENSSEISSSPPQRASKHCGFTPHRGIARLPRAWERKAATPFAPRVEGQRIWKRVPLAEIQSRNSTQLKPWSNGVVRVVKKMKMHCSEDQSLLNKEVSVETRTEGLGDLGERKRKVSGTTQSPTEVVVNTDDQDADNVDLITSGNTATELEAPHISEPVFEEMVAPPEVEQTENVEVSTLVEVNIVESFTQVDSDNTNEEDRDLPTQSVPEVSVESEVTDKDTEHRQKDVLEPLETSECLQTFDEANTSTSKVTSAADEALEAAPEHTEETTVLVHTEPMSRTTRRRSSLAAVFTGNGLVQIPDASELESAQTGISAKELSSPSDDTAFLHAFLTRARAQKAARAQSSPEKKKSEETLTTEPPSAIRGNDDQTFEGTDETTLTVVFEADKEETTLTSPCRRSTRTRLPRPQRITPVVPSSIPVRRSNGTEFIFLQRTEAQEVAITTRMNTRRNRGDAEYPRFKLPHINDPNYVSTLNQMAKVSPKKRRTRKEVSWNESKLTEIYETEAVEQEESKQEMQETTLLAENKPKARKMKKLGTVNGTPAPKRTVEEVETSSQVPERRLRSRTKR